MTVKVLMVCLGNICRSPLAEGILKSKVSPKKVFVDSAGTGGYHVGHQPDNRSIAVAQKHGIDIRAQRCRQFVVEDFGNFDFIYAMDQDNYKNIIALAKNSEDTHKVRLLLDSVNLGTKEVPDPYYGAEDGFDRVFDLIDRACEAIAKGFTKNQQ